MEDVIKQLNEGFTMINLVKTFEKLKEDGIEVIILREAIEDFETIESFSEFISIIGEPEREKIWIEKAKEILVVIQKKKEAISGENYQKSQELDDIERELKRKLLLMIRNGDIKEFCKINDKVIDCWNS